MKLSTTLAFVIGGIVFGALTYQQQFASRYHVDTWREESYRTTVFFGLPVMYRQVFVKDPHGAAYVAITGGAPRRDRWLRRRTDCVHSLLGTTYSCYGFGQITERRDLLEAVYARFPERLSRPEAAAYLRRIDQVLPFEGQLLKEADLEQVHLLRKELGLRSYFDVADPQPQ